MDGLSSPLLGIQRPVLGMEIMVQAEQSAQQKAETVIKKTEQGEKTAADANEFDDSYNGQNFTGREDGEESSDNKESGYFADSQKIKRFKVTFNPVTNMVELVDQAMGSVVETIAPNDLINIVSKKGGASGFLVDREC